MKNHSKSIFVDDRFQPYDSRVVSNLQKLTTADLCNWHHHREGTQLESARALHADLRMCGYDASFVCDERIEIGGVVIRDIIVFPRDGSLFIHELPASWSDWCLADCCAGGVDPDPIFYESLRSLATN